MPPKAAREGSRLKPEMDIKPLHRNAQSSFLSLPRSGILLSQFLQETEKKKRKSNRSSKSCQIRKRPLIIEFLRRYGGLKGVEIAQIMGIDYSTVSKERKRMSEALLKAARSVLKAQRAAPRAERSFSAAIVLDQV